MATINEMLKPKSIAELRTISAETLAAMTDEQLEIYLSDITNLEPKSLPVPLGTEVKEPKVKKVKIPKEESDKDSCPIKSTTKSAKDRAKLAALLAELGDELPNEQTGEGSEYDMRSKETIEKEKINEQ